MLSAADQEARNLSIRVLKTLRALAQRNKSRRLRCLLADFNGGYANGWHMAVPEAFRPRLGMEYDWCVTGPPGQKRRTRMWLQGWRRLTFRRGEVFYDVRQAGEGPWGQALLR